MASARLLPLSGAKTIGGSKLVLQFDGRNVLLDFGTDFHAINRYYEEFLQPRVPCGILDQITMGVLPDAQGVYREDLLHPDLSLCGPKIGRIDALLLSHAHTDHSGDIGFLRRDVPVITSTMSAAIAKAMQDSMKARTGAEVAYQNIRFANGKEDSVTLSANPTLSYEGRDFCLFDYERNEPFETFWNNLPGKLIKANVKKDLNPGRILDEVPGIKLDAHPVDHSIKGASAYIVKSDQGNVVYTGDIRLHGLEGDKTREFVEKAKREKPVALIIEGTTIGRNADPTTEQDVEKNIMGLISGMKGDIVISDFGPRNIERLEISLRAAKSTGRSLVVPPKDAYLLAAMNMVDPAIPVPGKGISIYDCPKEKKDHWERLIMEQMYPGDCVKPSSIRQSPGDYMIAFSFFDIKHLVDLRPKNGHYIYSSSEAHSEEQEIDFMRLRNWLDKFGVKYYGFAFDREGRPIADKTAGLHASGHASAEDIEKIVREIAPEAVIPVHTEEPEWFSKTFGGEMKVLLPEHGQWLDLN